MRLRFQSTFPRGERRMKIAICDDDNLHFNPRSHVGNDLVYCCRCGNHLNFNPRSHVGNDAGSVSILRRNIISIHVPTWGTTLLLPFLLSLQWNFNPRSHVGNDFFHPLSWLASGYFNPRSHVGNDFHILLPLFIFFYFNPRSHVGNDEMQPRDILKYVISIHVPTWGTTSQIQYINHKNKYFNPRSHVGNDR